MARRKRVDDSLAGEVLSFTDNKTQENNVLPENPTEEFLLNTNAQISENPVLFGTLSSEMGVLGFFVLNDNGLSVLSGEIVNLAIFSSERQSFVNIKELLTQNISEPLRALLEYLESSYRLTYCIFLV